MWMQAGESVLPEECQGLINLEPFERVVRACNCECGGAVMLRISYSVLSHLWVFINLLETSNIVVYVLYP